MPTNAKKKNRRRSANDVQSWTMNKDWFLGQVKKIGLEEVLRPHIHCLCKMTKKITKLMTILYSAHAIECAQPSDLGQNRTDYNVCSCIYKYMATKNCDGPCLVMAWGKTGNRHLVEHLRTEKNCLFGSSQNLRPVVPETCAVEMPPVMTNGVDTGPKKCQKSWMSLLKSKCVWALVFIIVLLAAGLALATHFILNPQHVELVKEKKVELVIDSTPQTEVLPTEVVVEFTSFQNRVKSSTPSSSNTVTVARVTMATGHTSQPIATMTSARPLTRLSPVTLSSLTQLQNLSSSKIEAPTVTVTSLKLRDLQKYPGPSSSPVSVDLLAATDRVKHLNVISPITGGWFSYLMTRFPHVHSLTIDVSELCRGSDLWGQTTNGLNLSGIENLRLLRIRDCPIYTIIMSGVDLPSLSRLDVHDSNMTLDTIEPLNDLMGRHKVTLTIVTFCRSTFCDDCEPYYDARFRKADFRHLVTLC